MENFSELTSDEKNVLNSVYGRQTLHNIGYNPNQLEEISELNAQEQKFFTGKNFVSPHFFVQTLYKVRGSVSPIKFNAVVKQLLRENKNLRANFCNVGRRTIKVIKPEIKPEIIFRNFMAIDKDELNAEFGKILEADMRRDLDIRHDPLIRFSIYKTDQEEFALLVTTAQIIAQSFDAEKFFCSLFNLLSDLKPKKNSVNLPLENQNMIREYWSKVLTDAPPPAALPYENNESGIYRQKVLRTTIPAEILSEVRDLAQSNRLMMTAILQSAWGFMLQLVNRRRDCLFCQILSAGDSSLNLIPVRLVSDNNLTVEQIIRRQFGQLVVSQTYSCVDWSSLDGLTAGKKLFGHFLSFKEFQSNELNYVETEAQENGQMIAQNSWDAQGMKLGVYFRYSEEKLSMTFLYNEKQFLNHGVERLCEMYKSVLEQVIFNWNEKFSYFKEQLAARIDMNLNVQSAEDEKKKIRKFILQLPLLQGYSEKTIGLFDEQPKLVTYYEGDRLPNFLLRKYLIFVAEGKLVRNVDTGDGWYNPLDIVGKNSFVNPVNILNKQRFALSAEILTEQAELLLISRDLFMKIVRENPEVAVSLINHVLEQMEKYQILWLQA